MVKAIREVSEYEEIAKFDGIWETSEIIDIVLEHTGWKYNDVFNKSKKAEAVFRRGIVDLICTANGKKIRYLAGITERDHTTIIHSLQNIERRLDDEKTSRNFLRDLMRSIKENNEKGL